ncbi:MAG: chemotaxis protein CheX [Bacteroidales bacterium]|nr:chemotaxis protein CheX [Candidatus Latescibacterota bacterium]
MQIQNDIIDTVFCDVLEQLAFMFGESVPVDEMPEAVDNGLAATMNFSGDSTGVITLVIPADMRGEFADNILGMDLDADAGVEDEDDAVREVLNIIAGNVLTALAGENALFDLAVPETRHILSDEWDSILSDSGSICFMLDEMPVILNLAVEG